MADSWERVRELFDAALDRGPAERREFLARECTDAGLRGDVESLLAAHDREGGAVEELRAGAMPRAVEEVLGHGLPDCRVGPWRLECVLASGGMGVVYRARHEEDGRVAALKLLRFAARSPAALRRFRDEGEILRRLRHPGIAQVYEAGVHRLGNGGAQAHIPYLALELVAEARPLDHAMDAEGADRRRRLEAFVEVCEAVHDAHQRGVIHRDLKHDNVLVGADGRPRVVDFGIARLVDGEAGTRPTATGQLLGTLSTMSPEQVVGDPDVDLRSDVYALGVMLYELLLRVPPYDLRGKAPLEAARIVREVEPRRPRDVDPEFPLELQWILQQALHKDKRRRTSSVAELRADVQRFLRGEPVGAGPPTTGDLVRAFLRRHRRAAALVGGAFAVLVIASLALSVGLVRALEESRRADQERDRAARAASSERVAREFLTEVLARAGGEGPARDRGIGPMVEQAAARLAERFTDDPLAQAVVHRTVGLCYRQVGAHAEAEDHLRAALELLRGPAQDPDELERAVLELGVLLREEDRFAEAAELLAEAAAGAAALWPEAGHPRRLQVEHEQGVLELRQRALEPARARLEAVWQARREVLGAVHEETLASADELVNALVALEDWDAAETVLQEVRSDLAAGDFARARLAVDERLASVWQEEGKRDAAAELYRSVLEGWRQRPPEQRPDLVRIARRLAAVHLAAERLPEAETAFRAALVEALERGGEDSAAALECRLDLALVLSREGAHDEALREGQRAATGLRLLLGDDHDLTRRAREGLLLVEYRRRESGGE